MDTCSKCRRSIQGRYVTSLGKMWHPECFVCQDCKTRIEGAFVEHQGQPYHKECYQGRFAPKCAACGQPLTGTYITALGKNWHENHFVCSKCQQPFHGSKFFERSGKPYCSSCYHQSFSPRCAYCQQPVTGEYTTALGKNWHPEHFLCSHCQRVLRSKKFYEKEGQAYCENCYHELFSLHCSICSKPMSGTYLTNYWGDSYCERHRKELQACYSCGRLISNQLNGGGVRYADGRHVCNNCRKTAIDQVEQGEKILREVRQVLKRAGVDTGNIVVPLRLVDQKEINKLQVKKYKTLPSGMTRTKIWTQNGAVTQREVEEILILHGLPMEHFAAVAAHEWGHVMLFVQEYPKIPPNVEEGICELCSFLWLKQRRGPQAAYHIDLLEKNEDPIYGDGFRQARLNLEKSSLSSLLDHVRRRKRFPK